MNRSRELSSLIRVAVEAGEFVKRELNNVHKFREKEDFSWVSEVDVNSDRLILERLKLVLPKYSIISEEGGGEIRNKNVWVDSLDGTTNYKHKLPYFCISIGVVENNIPFAGVVYNPMTGEIFYGERGKGSFVSRGSSEKGVRLHMSDTSSLDKAVVALERYSKGPFSDEAREIYKKIQKATPYTREMGSCALDMCYVASGIFDAALFVNNAHGYDVAAGIIILEEAGGKATNFSGENLLESVKKPDETFRGCVSSNLGIQPALNTFIRENSPY